MSRLARAPTRVRSLAAALLAAAACAACGGQEDEGVVVRFSGSALGAEAEVLRTQLARFMEANPGVRVEIQPTPDAADQRHQLYVQWLNARAGDPDVLQLDVIWTPEFAAAGWILPLDRFTPPVDSFFPATIEANRWRGRLFALPWFVDVGMLYWRTDLLPRAPETFEELRALAGGARERGGAEYGFVWQGARYEGLVTVFLEHLGGFGGRILDADGRVVVDEAPAVRALEYMRDAIESGLVPRSALTWQEEQTRFAFQNGQAVLMRNWPYAYALLADSAQSRVAGRFAVAPMPAAPGGHPTAALGGAQLAVNAYTEHPEAAYAVIEYLTRPEQMLERARVVGQYPTRPALYDDPALAASLAVPPATARAIIARAEPRPVTPVYTQLSELLQVRLHRALTGQQAPAAALEDAAREMRELLERVGLEPEAGIAGRRGPGRNAGRRRALQPAPACRSRATRRARRRGLQPGTESAGGAGSGGALGAVPVPAGATMEAREARLAWGFVLPALAVIALIALFPLAWTVWESLHLHDLRMPWLGRPFVGLEHYAEALGDARFWGALLHTGIFAAGSVTLELLLGLVLALALNRAYRGRGLVRVAVLVPWAIPTVVAALVWRFMFEGQAGIVNAVLADVGLVERSFVWFIDAAAAWVPVILADVWKMTPFVALLLLAGLQNIDAELYEAARIDGAGAWRQFVDVTLPLLKPAILVALIFRTLDAFRVFDLIYVMTGGGPGTSTEPIALYAFNSLLNYLRFGYGSALSVIIFLVTFALAVFYIRVLGADLTGERR